MGSSGVTGFLALGRLERMVVFLYSDWNSRVLRWAASEDFNSGWGRRRGVEAWWRKCPWPILSTNLSLSESDRLRWCSRLAMETLLCPWTVFVVLAEPHPPTPCPENGGLANVYYHLSQSESDRLRLLGNIWRQQPRDLALPKSRHP